jgi:hypothetical protein
MARAINGRGALSRGVNRGGSRWGSKHFDGASQGFKRVAGMAGSSDKCQWCGRVRVARGRRKG